MAERCVEQAVTLMLHGAEDFQNWKGGTKSYIESEDFELLGLTERPEEVTAAQQRKRGEANSKAKRVIVCALGPEPLACFCSLIDDGTAKQIWEELSRIYTTSTAQAVINLERELMGMSFADNGD